MTSQIRPRIEYLIPTDSILVLLYTQIWSKKSSLRLLAGFQDDGVIFQQRLTFYWATFTSAVTHTPVQSAGQTQILWCRRSVDDRLEGLVVTHVPLFRHQSDLVHIAGWSADSADDINAHTCGQRHLHWDVG